MTIIVLGHIRFAAGEFERLRPALAEMQATTRAEAGCELYAFAQAVDEPDLLVISERWASEEALAAHGASAHMQAFGATLGAAKVESISVKAWNGTFWRTVLGE